MSVERKISSKKALHATTPELPTPLGVKKIKVFKNADPYHQGVKVVVNGRQVHDLEVLLAALSLRVDLPYGAKKLYTTGGRQIKHISDLEDGKDYVASSNFFTPLPYGGVSHTPTAVKKVRSSKSQDPEHRKKKESKRSSSSSVTKRNGITVEAPVAHELHKKKKIVKKMEEKVEEKKEEAERKVEEKKKKVMKKKKIHEPEEIIIPLNKPKTPKKEKHDHEKHEEKEEREQEKHEEEKHEHHAKEEHHHHRRPSSVMKSHPVAEAPLTVAHIGDSEESEREDEEEGRDGARSRQSRPKTQHGTQHEESDHETRKHSRGKDSGRDSPEIELPSSRPGETPVDQFNHRPPTGHSTKAKKKAEEAS